jgi:hypothetical protein
MPEQRGWFDPRVHGYRLEPELWPEVLDDAIHDLRAVIVDETDWDGVQITVTRDGATTVDVQVRKENL